MELPAHNNEGQIKSERGGGLSGGGPGHLRKREEELNPDMDSRLRVMDNLRGFFNPVFS